jgi:IS4 transposase
MPHLCESMAIANRTPIRWSSRRILLSRNQHQTDPRSYVAAEFLVLATSLPAEEFPAEEVLAVYRLRWQIELAFKRLKSLIKIDEIRTRTEAGTRCWLYANLIVALLADDCSQDLLGSFPSGTR